MIQTVMNLQEAYAKALLVDRAALERAQLDGDVLAANRMLMATRSHRRPRRSARDVRGARRGGVRGPDPRDGYVAVPRVRSRRRRGMDRRPQGSARRMAVTVDDVREPLGPAGRR